MTDPARPPEPHPAPSSDPLSLRKTNPEPDQSGWAPAPDGPNAPTAPVNVPQAGPGFPPPPPGPGYGRGGYPPPAYPPPGYPGAGYGPPPGAYAPAGYAGADPSAPWGRDPASGEPLSSKSKVVAGLLQFFLGWLGVGRFYMGSTAIGAIQLALFVVGAITFIFIIGAILWVGLGIWAFVDAIVILAGSPRDERGLLLRS